jgi:cytidylate kinase
MNKGVENITLDGIIEDIRRRDRIDSTREESPLTRTEDSILVDTTDLSIEETVDMIINLVKGGK